MVEDLISIPEAAAVAGVHDRTIRRWISQGRLQVFKSQIGLRKFVRRGEIEQLKEPVLVGAAPEPVKEKKRRK